MLMKTTVCILLLILVPGFNNASFFQFGNMIKATSSMPPLAFNGYGNYCGILGKGEVLDNIDRCCRVHDKCLKKTNRKNCFPFSFMAYYIVPYRWNMQDGRIECATTNTRCGQVLCDCDRQCAECFAEYEHEYDQDLKGRLRLS